MRNDVKLGLAVGGLLLGVVLAYALFFSNTSKDRDGQLAGSYSGLENSNTAQRPAPTNTDTQQPQATDNNPPINNIAQPPAVADRQGPAPEPAPANPLIGRSWQLLLNEGASSNSTGTLTAGPNQPPANNRNVTPPTQDTGTARETITPPRRETTVLVDPPPTPAGPRRYTIKNGDTFWTIAKAEYGNGAYFGHIQRANPSVDPGRIKAGDSIVLPDKNEVVANAPAAARQPSAAELVNFDPAKQYRVQAGDNLSTISKKLYGRFDKWAQIYELNKELIGPNPGALKRDMILALPDPPARSVSTIQ